MWHRKVGKAGKPIKLNIGLLCSKSFDDAIFEELFWTKYRLRKEEMVKMNIKGVFQIWMRNGDYIPTRLDAQQDAANLVSNAKTQQNPENTVGVLSMAGSGRHSGATLLASPTDDMGKILASLHGVKIAGKLNFLEGVQVAQLGGELAEL